MRKYSLLFFMTLFLGVSLGANEDKYIKDALLKYNYGIIKMGKTGETEFFKEFVKEDVAIKLQVWFESWKFSNLTYIAKINDLRFSPIAYNKDNATIRTLESWTYSYVNLVTRKEALEPRTTFYKMFYTLKKDGNKWMIVDVKKLEEETFQKKEQHKPASETKVELPEDDIQAENLKVKIATH